MKRLTQAEFARLCRVNRSTVTRWGQDGKIVLVDGGVDVEASFARLNELGVGKLRPDVAARHAEEAARKAAQGTQTAATVSPHGRAQENATAGQPGATTNDVVLPDVPTSGGRARYKAIALSFENQQIKIGMALGRGMRYYRADIEAEAAGLGGLVRAAVERLTDLTAPRLAVLSSPIERLQLLKREVTRIQRMVNREYPNTLRRLRRGAKLGKSE
jgi:hypothetical protein